MCTSISELKCLGMNNCCVEKSILLIIRIIFRIMPTQKCHLILCICPAGSVPHAACDRDGGGGRCGRDEPVSAGPLYHPGTVPATYQGDAVRGAGPPRSPHFPPDATPVHDPSLAKVMCEFWSYYGFNAAFTCARVTWDCCQYYHYLTCVLGTWNA